MGPRSILVVEDDADTRDALCQLLTGEGYEVREAEDGQQAVYSLVHQDVPSLILLDRFLPRMGAAQFLDWLGEDPRFQAVAVIVASGDPTVFEHPRVASVLQKPYEVKELLHLIRRSLEPGPAAP